MNNFYFQRINFFIIFIFLFSLFLNLVGAVEIGENSVSGVEIESAGIPVFDNNTMNVSGSYSAEVWETAEGSLDDVSDISHSWLSDLVWSVAGHTFDTTVDFSGENVTDITNATATDFYGDKYYGLTGGYIDVFSTNSQRFYIKSGTTATNVYLLTGNGDGGVIYRYEQGTTYMQSINGADFDYYMFNDAASGENMDFRIYGYPAGESKEYGQLKIASGPAFQLTSSTGEISFDDENLTTTGNMTATAFHGAKFFGDKITIGDGYISKTEWWTGGLDIFMVGGDISGVNNFAVAGNLYVDHIGANGLGNVHFTDGIIMDDNWFYPSSATDSWIFAPAGDSDAIALVPKEGSAVWIGWAGGSDMTPELDFVTSDNTGVIDWNGTGDYFTIYDDVRFPEDTSFSKNISALSSVNVTDALTVSGNSYLQYTYINGINDALSGHISLANTDYFRTIKPTSNHAYSLGGGTYFGTGYVDEYYGANMTLTESLTLTLGNMPACGTDNNASIRANETGLYFCKVNSIWSKIA